jgi:hypothetical protein
MKTVLPELLEVVPVVVRQGLWFQHDKPPVHYGQDIQQWLSATCPGRGNGQRGKIEWPPLSPVLTLKEWGHLKQHVYALPLRTVEDFVVRLQATLTRVDTYISWRVQQRHAAKCRLY